MIALIATCAAITVLSEERHHSLRDGRGELPSPVFSIGGLRALYVLVLMVAGTLEWYQRSEQYFIGCPDLRSLPHVYPARASQIGGALIHQYAADSWLLSYYRPWLLCVEL